MRQRRNKLASVDHENLERSRVVALSKCDYGARKFFKRLVVRVPTLMG